MNEHDEEFAIEIGLRLRRFRRKTGMSQVQLARRAGLHRNTIGAIERGKRNMGTETLVLIIAALGASPKEILGGIEWIPGVTPPTGAWRSNQPRQRD